MQGKQCGHYNIATHEEGGQRRGMLTGGNT
jgi:hypothetical protein